MELREFFSEDAIQLNLAGNSKDEVLKEMIQLLDLDEKSQGILFKMLKRRENLGSTGIGRGIAIPHCRSLVVDRLRIAFGRTNQPIEFDAIDDNATRFFFLIVAPPLEVSNQYLPVLGKIAQFAKETDVPDRLATITDPEQFLAQLEILLQIQDLRSQRDRLAAPDPGERTLQQEQFNIDVDKAIATLEQKIGTMENELDPSIRTRYDRIARGRDRVVAPVINGTC